MKQIERIVKNLRELGKHDAKYTLYQPRKRWLLIYKDNKDTEITYFIKGLKQIEAFVLEKCIKLDETTGISVEE